MKVAFLFSGQLRELEYDLFRKSLVNLTKDLDYSIFAYTLTGKSPPVSSIPSTNNFI